MSGRYRFERRWGAWRDADGLATFRIWAPGVEGLRLRLEPGGEQEMTRSDDGWFEFACSGVEQGASYSFVLPDGMAVPDPAARAQSGDVHGPSRLIDPHTYEWQATEWRGRPWEEAVVYELHTGTFSESGDFNGIRHRLDEIAESGVTAIEIMPVAQFSGNRGWGYDGVLLYSPHPAYGGVEGLKRLVDAAHERGLMMILDVVYNHFGPDGNYIHAYAPQFFNPDLDTPWGPAIDFTERAVRDFFVDNPLYWLEEYRFDGLRFDAIDQIHDPSGYPILAEMAKRIREQFPHRHIHLMTEDERNIVELHPRDDRNEPLLFTAEWNDDVHHAAHCVATGEDNGYYAAFADDPVGHLARALAEGFCYQGEPYKPWGGEPRGVPSSPQPPTAFVAFIQNHDQTGNRAFGERLTTLTDAQTVELLTAILLLNPQIPLLFMGEEYGETRPFLFFTDFHGDLAQAVREGRRREFAAFTAFSDKDAEKIPDPNSPDTFAAACLDREKRQSEAGQRRLALVRRLIDLRQAHIVPRIGAMKQMHGEADRLNQDAFSVRWRLGDDTTLRLFANFGESPAVVPAAPLCESGTLIYESGDRLGEPLRKRELPGRCVAVFLGDGG